MKKVDDNAIPDLAEVTEQEAKLQKEIQMLIISFKIATIDMDEVFAGYLIESMDLIRSKQGKQTVEEVMDLKAKYDRKFQQEREKARERENAILNGI